MWPIAALVVGKFMYDLNKACDMDEDSRRRMRKAFQRETEARLLVKQKSQELEAALGRIVQRKRGTLSNFRRFVDLYQKIMDIDFQAEKRQPVLAVIPLKEEDFAGLQQMVLIPKRAFTDSEVLMSLLKGGLGRSMLDDAEQFRSQSVKQLRAAGVVYAQAENMARAIDIMVGQCETISEVIAHLNFLLAKTIRTSEVLMEAKGSDPARYTRADRDVLMTCMNVVDALKKIVDAPVVTRDGQLTKEIMTTIRMGREYAAAVKKSGKEVTTMKRLKIDGEKCTGCGTCLTFSDYISEGPDGKARVKIMGRSRTQRFSRQLRKWSNSVRNRPLSFVISRQHPCGPWKNRLWSNS